MKLERNLLPVVLIAVNLLDTVELKVLTKALIHNLEFDLIGRFTLCNQAEFVTGLSKIDLALQMLKVSVEDLSEAERIAVQQVMKVGMIVLQDLTSR